MKQHDSDPVPRTPLLTKAPDINVVRSHAQQHNTRKRKSPEPYAITLEYNHHCSLNY